MPNERRLDSWKTIAEYLGRDVRTVMRWSKAQGLPVRRVAGGKGRSVYAFAEEIDEWLKGRTPDAADAEPARPAQDADAPPLPAAPERGRVTRLAAVAATLLVIALGVIGPRIVSTRGTEPSEVAIDRRGVHRVTADGASSLIFSFERLPGAVPLSRTTSESLLDLDDDGTLDVVAAISVQEQLDERRVHSGRILRLDAGGPLRWSHEVADAFTMGDTVFRGPWAIVDWQVSPPGGARALALAAHHYTWWPGLVAVVGADGARISTFVNAGWVEGVRWLDRDRLVVAGFNNPRDAGMVAIISPSSGGHLPEARAEFRCASCGDGRPTAYVTFARSELNVVTASRFNRARAEVSPDGIIVQTLELGEDVPGATAIYDFDRELRLRRARFSDQYWDVHRRLELEGRLAHSRETCPQMAPSAERIR